MLNSFKSRAMNCGPLSEMIRGCSLRGQFGVGQFGVGQFGVGQFGVGQFGVGQFGVGQFGVGQFGVSSSLLLPLGTIRCQFIIIASLASSR